MSDIKKIKEFKDQFKKCKDLQKKGNDEYYNDLIEKIEETYNKLVKKQNYVVSIIDLDTFFRVTKKAITAWINSNDIKNRKKNKTTSSSKKEKALKALFKCCDQCIRFFKEIIVNSITPRLTNDNKGPIETINPPGKMYIVYNIKNKDIKFINNGKLYNKDAALTDVVVSNYAKNEFNSTTTDLAKPPEVNCTFYYVSGIKVKSTELLRLYICMEMQFDPIWASFTSGPDKFDFKNYKFEGKKSYTDEEFKERKFYKIKNVDVKVSGIGTLKITVFISSVPGFVGKVTQFAINNSFIKVDGQSILPLI